MGGNSLYEMGNASEMENFFDYLRTNLKCQGHIHILNRLYKKYIRYEELGKAAELIAYLRSNQLLGSASEYVKYIDAIDQSIDAAESFYKRTGIYQPLKTGIITVPFCIDETRRPLEMYDALEDDDLPFWMRPNKKLTR